jgi:hypothetical protein
LNLPIIEIAPTLAFIVVYLVIQANENILTPRHDRQPGDKFTAIINI